MIPKLELGGSVDPDVRKALYGGLAAAIRGGCVRQ